MSKILIIITIVLSIVLIVVEIIYSCSNTISTKQLRGHSVLQYYETVVLVYSSPKNLLYRNNIRNTWKKETTMLKFFIGKAAYLEYDNTTMNIKI